MSLKLYNRYQNSAGQRVRIVLNLKSIPYEYVSIDGLPPGRYQEINPQGLMPALELDGRVVAQSQAIIELLEELYPNPSVLPKDPWARAEARSFAALITSDLHPVNNRRIQLYLANELGATEAQVQAWYRHWVATAYGSLETMLAGRSVQFPFCYGDTPSVADAALVPQMDNTRRLACDLTPYPRLLAVDARCRALAAFQRAASEVQPDYPGRT
ncbi:MAG: maleylacetoacetate isomerase [Alphaproteobacteria bacterium]|nr:maleylacetoacetate isomerase [Alphaproteobacteria bacterium]